MAATTAAAMMAAALVVAGPHVQGSVSGDPLGILAPERRAAAARGAAVIEVLPTSGPGLEITGAVRTSADSARLAAWAREIDQLHAGKYVPLIRRFSSPPRLEDVATLALDDEELADLRECRPGRCALKLAAPEIQHITGAARAGGKAWKPAVLQAFREVMVQRAQTYLKSGFAGIGPTHDQARSEDLRAEFRSLRRGDDHPVFTPAVTRFFDAYPQGETPAESFLYWSKDLLGDAKPIVSITHLTIFDRGGESVAVAGVQVFATHYLTASLSVMAIVEGNSGADRYLLYVRRSRTDVFDGAFGGFIRRVVNRRIRSEGPPALDRIRRVLEKGWPRSMTPADSRF